MSSTCASIDALVTPFVDGELSPSDHSLVARHIERCRACRARVETERLTRELLHARQPSLHACSAPAMLRSRCAELAARESGSPGRPGAAVRPGPRPGASGWRSRLAPLAAAAVLVLVVGGAFLYQATSRSARVMAAELAADHVKCFAMNAVLGTHHSDTVVESAMASGFAWNMTLPGGAARDELTLVGSRPCLYGEGKIAHIMYRHQGRPVSLFMLPRTERQPEVIDVLGHSCAIWSGADRTFVLVSRGDRAEVQKLAALVQLSWK